MILNAGITLDGKIASRSGNTEISSPEDMLRVHGIRKEVDAIMVGINTVLADDPKLTAHKVSDDPGDNPLRVVVDSRARTPLGSRVLNHKAETLIAVSETADAGRVEALREHCEVVVCGRSRVDLGCLMGKLHGMGVRTLLLEGGGTLNWSMLEAGFVDEVRVAIAPWIVGGKDAVTLVEGEGFDRVREGVELRLLRHYTLGPDLVLEYEVKKYKSG
ncbi:MAG: 2,5-diamino-6-(ribosylamino)-4(3H)-pyrimidinone 5'-phosphate reductase [Euryarchaeota archaeon]|nr:2,5-diamino-6-(ribosylamino)-4(3H)-pyrimidinone 5'-phosphate reductase [Euryarchaeota archaeon]